MKLVKIAERKTMLKVILDDGKETWADTTKPVYEYTKKNFKEGEEVIFTYEQKGELPFITRIEKLGQKSTQQSSQVQESKKFSCEECGKELKDNKYKRCYDCNKKTPPKDEKDISKSESEKTTTTNSIEKQNINNAVSRALIALQGHVNLDNILEIAEKLRQFFAKNLQ